MKLVTLTFAAALMIPAAAFAQSNVPAGAAAGAAAGAVVGGPVGAVVGGTAGAVAGGISDADRPKFREYVVTQKHPSYKYSGNVAVGAELPASGVTYYDVPAQYKVNKYKYTIVNDRPVLVDPGSRKVVEVIE